MADVNVSGSGDTAASPSASAAPVATPQAPTAPVAATPATSQAPATGAPGEGWVPSYRVRETREAAFREANESFAQKEADYRAQLAQVQSQLHALVGVQPQANPELKAVRDQFGNLYPGLSKLEAAADRILALEARSGDLEAQSSHYWTRYGQSTMDKLFDHASTSLGTPLTEAGKRQLHSSFVGFVQSSPELTERYANDPSIVEDFWKEFTSNFVDPARRVASATVAGRAVAGATTPQDTPGGAPRVAAPPKLADLDERAAAAWAHYNTIAKP